MTFYLQNNHVIYEGDPGALPQYIPDLKRINGSYFAIPASLQNLQVLAHYNYIVPPYITEQNYDFPIEPGRKPLPHQKVMANFVVLHRRAFNLSSMGTMKTISTLWGADFLMRQHPNEKFRALIVAPLSTLQHVWASAIYRNFLSRRTFAILHGSAEKRAQELEKDVDFYITNFEGVGVGSTTRRGKFEIGGFSQQLIDRQDIKLVIIDEASAYKDATTKRHKVARAVLGKREYLWALSGSPTPNAPTDAYGLAKLLNNAWGKSFRQFQFETMYKITDFRWQPKKDGYQQAAKLLSPSIRYELEDVWSGLEMTTQQREAELTAEQKRLMQELKRGLQVELKSGQPITAANEVAARTKYLQIALGAVYDERHKTHHVDASPRMSVLSEVLEQATGKFLVFAPLTSVVNLLHANLKKKYDVAVVNGDVSPKDRSKIFAEFQQEGGIRGIIADPGTMAHGLDLWMARTVIWYGPVDKAELYDQANHRAFRPGQKFPVSVVQIVSNPLDREIFRRLESNLSMQGALLTMIKNGEI